MPARFLEMGRPIEGLRDSGIEEFRDVEMPGCQAAGNEGFSSVKSAKSVDGIEEQQDAIL